MNEHVEGFKIDLEELMIKWYEELELLVNDTMYNMSFFDDNYDENYELLQAAMIEIIQAKMASVLEEVES